MPKISGNATISALVFLVILSLFSVWVINSDPLESYLSSVSLEAQQVGIKDVDISYKNNRIYLSIKTEKHMSCKTAISVLGIQKFVIRDRVYVPECKQVSGKLIQIQYRSDKI